MKPKIILPILILLILIAYVPLWGLAGWDVNPRRVASLTQDRILALLKHNKVLETNQEKYSNVVFLHHSVGKHLINEGNIRELLSAEGISFWDHGYNWQGLNDPDGKYTGYSYNVWHDSTSVEGFLRIFSQKVYKLPWNTLSGLMQHEVIIIKSCYPNSQINNQDEYEYKQNVYNQIREQMEQYPEKVFILVTSPPLNPASTDAESAERARKLSTWLSTEFAAESQNVYVFNLFEELIETDPQAEDRNMLREDYRDGEDSHPNETANQAVGRVFTEFILEIIEKKNK